MKNLSCKVALVTGSAQNIGREIVLELARRGANVVVNARTSMQAVSNVAREAEALGVKAIPILADVGDEVQVAAMVEQVLDAFGHIDILINNAGLRRSCPITDMTTEAWREILAANLDGPFFCCRAVVPNMIANGGGRIITISGLNAFKGRADWAHVCASKVGSLGLARALAVELAPHNILVNHIVPGPFETSRTASSDMEARARRIADVVLGRLGQPQEMANLCAFLCSEDASFMTGQTIHFNGGAFRY